MSKPEGIQGFESCGKCPVPLPPLYGAYWRWGTTGNIPPLPALCGFSADCLSGQTTSDLAWPDFNNPDGKGFSGNSNIYVLRQNAYTYVGAPPPVGSLRSQDVQTWVRLKNPGHPYDLVYVPPVAFEAPDPEVLPYPDWVRNLPSVRPLPGFSPDTAPGGPRPYPKRVRKEVPIAIPDWYEVGPKRRENPLDEPLPSTSPWDDPEDDPFPVSEPGTEPGPGPGADPGPGTQPGTDPSPGTDPTGEVSPQTKGGLIPLEALTLADAQLEVDALHKAGKITRSTHKFARPPPFTKEKKGSVVFGPGGAGKVYGLVTESKDAIKCVWGALPRDVRMSRGRGNRTLPNMLDDIWSHADEIDVAQAIKCLVMNEVQDRAIGRASRLGKKLWKDNLPKGYKPVRGPQYGGAFNRHTAGMSARQRFGG